MPEACASYLLLFSTIFISHDTSSYDTHNHNHLNSCCRSYHAYHHTMDKIYIEMATILFSILTTNKLSGNTSSTVENCFYVVCWPMIVFCSDPSSAQNTWWCRCSLRYHCCCCWWWCCCFDCTANCNCHEDTEHCMWNTYRCTPVYVDTVCSIEILSLL